jgi:hypothetical protein
LRRPFYGWIIVAVSFLIGFTESGVFQESSRCGCSLPSAAESVRRLQVDAILPQGLVPKLLIDQNDRKLINVVRFLDFLIVIPGLPS